MLFGCHGFYRINSIDCDGFFQTIFLRGKNQLDGLGLFNLKDFR